MPASLTRRSSSAAWPRPGWWPDCWPPGAASCSYPLFIVAFGFTAARAAGTSLVVAAALTVPTLVTHWLLGNIDWSIAGAFALGMVPASFAAARVGMNLPDRVVRPAFGAVVLLFSLYFVATQLG